MINLIVEIILLILTIVGSHHLGQHPGDIHILVITIIAGAGLLINLFVDKIEKWKE